MRRTLAAFLSGAQLGQVEHLAVDNPNVELFSHMKAICPALNFLSMDTVHLVMRYEDAQGRGRTPGSSWLRLALQRFCKRDATRNQGSWGAVYYGGTTAPSQDELACLEQIRLCSMPILAAEKELLSLADKAELPFLSRHEFLRAVSAIVAMHPSEVHRQLPKGDGTVLNLVYQRCHVQKVEWMLNYTRFLHAISSREHVVLPRGTTSNEAYHAELNSAFRRVQSLHTSSLEMRLRAITLAKLLSHNSALYRAGTRQSKAGTVLMRTVAATTLFSQQQWVQWLKQPSDAHAHSQRAHGERKRLRDWTAEQSGGVRKKPSARSRLILRKPVGQRVVHATPQDPVRMHRTVYRLVRKTKV